MRNRVRLIIGTLVVLALIAAAFLAGGAHKTTAPAAAETTNVTAPAEPRPNFGLPLEEYAKKVEEVKRAVNLTVATGILPNGPEGIEPFNSSCTNFYVGQPTGPENGTAASAGHCDLMEDAIAHFTEECKNSKPDPKTKPKGKESEEESDEENEGCKTPLKPILKYEVIHPTDLDSSCPGQPSNKGTVRNYGAHPVGQPLELANGDGMLLRVPGLECVKTLKPATRNPYPGEQVLSLGFDGVDSSSAADSVDPEDPSSDKDYSNARLRMTESIGIFSGEQYPGAGDADSNELRFNGGTQYLSTSGNITPGMSGGPTLIWEDGEFRVVGVNSFIRGAKLKGFFTSNGDFRLFLRSKGIRIDEAAGDNITTTPIDKVVSTENTANQPSSRETVLVMPDNMFWVAVAILVLLSLLTLAALVIGLIWLIRRYRRRPTRLAITA